MTLLDFARGPGLQWALIILVAGMAIRLVGALFLAREKDWSAPRRAVGLSGVRAVFTRFWPHKEFVGPTLFHMVAGYVLHIGLFVVILLFAPHVVFLTDTFGLPAWPALPNDIVMIAGVLTAASLIAFMVRRMTHPVMRQISGFDDYVANLLTLLPVVTGIMATAHVAFVPYETMLALHILSVELLMIWIPISKLSHMFMFIPSRYQLGATLGRRGVKA